jgi:hypothetical protein
VFSAAFHHGAGVAVYERGSKELSSEMFALLAHKKFNTGEEAGRGVAVSATS